MKITAVVATFNRRAMLRRLLLQLQAQKLPSATTLSIVVVNDGSTDGTREMLREEFPAVSVLTGNGSWWWTRCMNEGFREALKNEADAVLVLNDDVELKPDYLEVLLKDHAQLPDGSILGSVSLSVETPHLIESSGTYAFNRTLMKFRPYHRGLQKADDVNLTGVHDTFTLAGRGTLIPASVFLKAGYYDNNLVQYGSDDEFVFRAKLLGVPVFISWNARVYTDIFNTSAGTAFKKDKFSVFLKSFFSKYTVNSLSKVAYLYGKIGYRPLMPVFLLYFVLGTVYAKYIKYR